VLGARVRLVSLWFSQSARVLADWCLRVAALLHWAGAGPEARNTAWHIATGVFIAPFLLLAPLNGCLSNSLPRRGVLVGACAFSLAAVAVCAESEAWMVCLGLAALAAAVYSPARYAMLPAAAADTHIPLPRVNGLIELGGAAAIVGGAALGWKLAGPHGAGHVAAVLLGLNLLALLAALPAAFPSDVRRPEPPLDAVEGFFTDLRRTLAQRNAAASLLGLAAFQAVVTAGSGALLTIALAAQDGPQDRFLDALVTVMVGAAFGCGVAALQGHPRRSLGLVPFGATLLLAALGWAAAAGPGAASCMLLGFAGALVNVPLRAAYLAAVPADARGNAMAVMNSAIYLLTVVLAGLVVAAVGASLLTTPLAQALFLAALTAGGAAVSWYVLLPQAIEQVFEILFFAMYCIRTYGPGKDLIPTSGPLILVANHTAYADPLWIGKILPRRLTPLMTSLFYDLPVVHWLMVHVVGAIRVPLAHFRREAPELHQAIEVLRRGGAVLIFPEGMLRRTAEPGVRLFGQGVWHLLHELPQTPVVVFWIEGGWGSFSSYYNGLPMKNKRLDWRRPIDIAVERPQLIDPAILADPLATRTYLMRTCLECRRYLGLEVPAGRDGHLEEYAAEDSVPGPDARPIQPT
jgi:1-acyl-sn-glycerol-3-phosphate acyltransferase